MGNSTWPLPRFRHPSCGGWTWLLCGHPLHSELHGSPAISPTESSQGESSKGSIPFEPLSLPPLPDSPNPETTEMISGQQGFPLHVSQEDQTACWGRCAVLRCHPGCLYLCLHVVSSLDSHKRQHRPGMVLLRKTSSLFLGFLKTVRTAVVKRGRKPVLKTVHPYLDAPTLNLLL